jgi:hypothetical protein
MKMIHVKKESFLKAKADAEKGYSFLKDIQESVVIDAICAVLMVFAIVLKVSGFLSIVSGEVLWMGLLFFIGNVVRNISIVRGAQ